MAIIMGAMAAGLATMGAIIMPIIMGAGAGASLPPRDALLGSSTVSTTCTMACRNHSISHRLVWSHAPLSKQHHEHCAKETPCWAAALCPLHR